MASSSLFLPQSSQWLLGWRDPSLRLGLGEHHLSWQRLEQVMLFMLPMFDFMLSLVKVKRPKVNNLLNDLWFLLITKILNPPLEMRGLKHMWERHRRRRLSSPFKEMTPQSPAGTQTGLEGRQKQVAITLQIAHFFFSNALGTFKFHRVTLIIEIVIYVN